MTEADVPRGLRIAATVLAPVGSGLLRMKMSPEHGRPDVTRDIPAEALPESLRKPDTKLWVVLDSGDNVSAAWRRRHSVASEGPAAADMVVGVVVASLWIMLKLWYREVVKERYGFFSWAYLRAALISFAILVAAGILTSWLARHWYDDRKQ